MSRGSEGFGVDARSGEGRKRDAGRERAERADKGEARVKSVVRGFVGAEFGSGVGHDDAPRVSVVFNEGVGLGPAAAAVAEREAVAELTVGFRPWRPDANLDLEVGRWNKLGADVDAGKPAR